MKFKIDENLPTEIADLFKEEGYSALTVLDQGLGGSVDSQVFEICSREKRVLITLDLDFSDLRTYPPKKNQGVIVLRAAHHSKKILLDFVRKILPLLKKQPLKGHLWIVEAGRVRIRGE